MSVAGERIMTDAGTHAGPARLGARGLRLGLRALSAPRRPAGRPAGRPPRAGAGDGPLGRAQLAGGAGAERGGERLDRRPRQPGGAALSHGRGPGAALSGAGRLGHRAVVSRHRVGPAECAHQLRSHAGRRGHGSARRLAGARLRLARLVRAHRAARAARRRRLVLVRAGRAGAPPCDASGGARADRCGTSARQPRDSARGSLAERCSAIATCSSSRSATSSPTTSSTSSSTGSTSTWSRCAASRRSRVASSPRPPGSPGPWRPRRAAGPAIGSDAGAGSTADVGS